MSANRRFDLPLPVGVEVLHGRLLRFASPKGRGLCLITADLIGGN